VAEGLGDEVVVVDNDAAYSLWRQIYRQEARVSSWSSPTKTSEAAAAARRLKRAGGAHQIEDLAGKETLTKVDGFLLIELLGRTYMTTYIEQVNLQTRSDTCFGLM
jgi:cysteine synthase